MTASRAAYLDGMQEVLDRLRANPSIPLPPSCWALPFRAVNLDQAMAIAAALGITGRDVTSCPDEAGSWLRLRGRVGGVAVEVTAQAEPVLADPLGEPYAAWSLAGGLAVTR